MAFVGECIAADITILHDDTGLDSSNWWYLLVIFLCRAHGRNIYKVRILPRGPLGLLEHALDLGPPHSCNHMCFMVSPHYVAPLTDPKVVI